MHSFHWRNLQEIKFTTEKCRRGRFHGFFVCNIILMTMMLTWSIQLRTQLHHKALTLPLQSRQLTYPASDGIQGITKQNTKPRPFMCVWIAMHEAITYMLIYPLLPETTVAFSPMSPQTRGDPAQLRHRQSPQIWELITVKQLLILE